MLTTRVGVCYTPKYGTRLKVLAIYKHFSLLCRASVMNIKNYIANDIKQCYLLLTFRVNKLVCFSLSRLFK